MKVKPKIVIVGGGMAGHKIAHALQDLAEITLVDPKDFFEIPMAAPRLLVAPGSLPAIIPYRAFLSRVSSCSRLAKGGSRSLDTCRYGRADRSH